MNKFGNQSNTESQMSFPALQRDEFKIIYHHRKQKKLKKLRQLRKLKKKMILQYQRQAQQQDFRRKTQFLNMNMLQEDYLWDQVINPQQTKLKNQSCATFKQNQNKLQMQLRIIHSLPYLPKKSVFLNEFQDFYYEVKS